MPQGENANDPCDGFFECNRPLERAPGMGVNQRAPRLIRKTSHGRTNLFIPDTSVVFREVKCMGGVEKRGSFSIYHVLEEAWKDPRVVCWHCCENVGNSKAAVPIPRVYDHSENAYHVFGKTCSPSCAKAYVLEHTTFDRGQRLNVLSKMLKDVYEVEGVVKEAPPRASLKRFGGPFDVNRELRAECKLIEPPFVSYCMVVEEHVGEDSLSTLNPPAAAEEEDAFERVVPAPLFDDFVERIRNEGSERAGPCVPPPEMPAAASSSEISSSGKEIPKPSKAGRKRPLTDKDTKEKATSHVERASGVGEMVGPLSRFCKKGR